MERRLEGFAEGERRQDAQALEPGIGAQQIVSPAFCRETRWLDPAEAPALGLWLRRYHGGRWLA
jgi:hypothetical protein